MRNKFISITVILLILACNKSSKEFKIEFYKNGKIKMKGYFYQDSIPIDTIHTYYENGSIKSVDIYDSIGRLNGICHYYYNNGNLKQRLNYSNNFLLGFVEDFDLNGIRIAKAFYYNNKIVGDYYEYSRNNIYTYRFYDFQNHLLNRIVYDSSLKIKTLTKQVIFIDSLNIKYENNKTLINLLIISSNPFKTSNTFTITYHDYTGKTIGEDSCVESTKPYYAIRKEFGTNLSLIKVNGEQFDSISNRIKYQISENKVEYIK